MKKLLTILLFSICINNIASAQTTFQKTIGGTADDIGYSIQLTSDGGYIVTGESNSFSGGEADVYLIRFDADGDTLWTKTYGGTDSDYGKSVQQTADGGYIIAGYTNSFGAGYQDVYLIKTNASGDTSWTNVFGGAGGDYGYAVDQTSDGGYIVAGETNGFGAGNVDIYLIRTNADGDTLWTKTYGGSGYELSNSVQQTADGGYIIGGQTDSYGAGNTDLYLIRTDADGDTLWTKTYGGIGYELEYSVQQTTDGGYIIAGHTFTFGSNDVYLVKTNSAGNTLWSKTYGGIDVDLGNSVQQTTDGGYIIAGNTYAFGAGSWDAYLIKTEADGDTLWTKTIGAADDDRGNSVKQTADGGYIITGHSQSFGAGYHDVYMIKTDATGNSGCNQENPPTLVTTAATLVSSTTTITAPSATIVTGTETVTDRNTGTVTTLCTIVGSYEPAGSDLFSVYPNPCNTYFTLQLNTAFAINNTVLNVTDISGRLVHTTGIYNRKSELDITSLTKGIYFITLHNNEGVATRKIEIVK